VRGWLPVAFPIAGAVFVNLLGVGVQRWFSNGSRPSDRLGVPPMGITSLQPEHYAGRLGYASAVEFQIAACMAALIAGAWVIWKTFAERKSWWRLLVLIAVLGLSTLLVFAFVGEAPIKALDKFVPVTIAAEIANILDVHRGFDAATFVCAAFLILIMGLLLRPPDGTSTEQRQQQLNVILGVGTVFLAASVYRLAAIGRWAAGYYAEAQRKPIEALMNSVVSVWGLHYTLLLAASFLPAALILRRRADKAETSVAAEIARVTALLAPFLVGQVADLIQ
jgi:hypothetical protein